jgi:ZIP family zinc transporter
MNTVLIAILLTAGAGLATAIGSLVAVFWREPGPRFMAATLGFSAGVMIHVSYVELLAGGMETLDGVATWPGGGFVLGHLAFFGGVLLMFAVDLLVSHIYIMESPGPAAGLPSAPEPASGARLRRASVLVAAGIAVHNFPEGMATFMATLKDVSLGGTLAVAIAIHNIPEGVAVAVPVYAVTRSAKKAFLWSLLSGVSEPVGAVMAWLVLAPFMGDAVLACTLCAVGGFMVYISFDELLPVAHSYGQEHVCVAGVVAGMVVMAASLSFR